MDSSAAAEPCFSSTGVQPGTAATECNTKAIAEDTAEPSAATFRRVVQASNLQPPILHYQSKALYVETLAGYYVQDVFTFRLPQESLLTPVFNFPTRHRVQQGKVQFESYLYQRKILLSVETSDQERHELYYTHCFDTPVPAPATHNLPGFWMIKGTRMMNLCMHDHIKLGHPELPHSYEQEKVRFGSLGQSVIVSLKRRCPDDKEREDDEEDHFQTKPSGIPLSKRIFRRLLALFILLSNVAERIVENTYFRQLLISWSQR
ncbi:hypothetical protein FN846DRAFT_886255 [Sphaerosporella brunnea]|uniref:Uncharacterized protein n=1 Tax=Sphaerosporella brunnea TaxID=1250544 RepID=A0A5J5FAY4_9PEZI|nr:hypothetical protein FN846DRAFT_886255 [Sphaerosporella brunnea]